VTDKHLLQ